MSRKNRPPGELAQYATLDVFTSEGGLPPFAEGERQSPAPTDAERALMAPWGIQFDGRAFRFAGHCHARLADAMSYARRANAAERH